MRLIRYTRDPSPIVPWSVDQSRDSDRFMIGKPLGMFVSVEGENDWRQWCLDEGFMIEHLEHEHEVKLAPDANILMVTSLADLDRFDAEYAEQGSYPKGLRVDWPRVQSDGYQGIIIAPYQWQRRLSLLWYYCWDCASGCIWDARAIQSIKLIVPERVENLKWMNSRA